MFINVEMGKYNSSKVGTLPRGHKTDVHIEQRVSCYRSSDSEVWFSMGAESWEMSKDAAKMIGQALIKISQDATSASPVESRVVVAVDGKITVDTKLAKGKTVNVTV